MVHPVLPHEWTSSRLLRLELDRVLVLLVIGAGDRIVRDVYVHHLSDLELVGRQFVNLFMRK